MDVWAPVLMLMFSLSAGQSQSPDPTPDIEQREILVVEQNALENRLRIRQWHIRVAFRYREVDREGEVAAYNLFMDGDRVREDLTWYYSTAEQFPGLDEDRYVSYDVWNDDVRIMYTTQRFPEGASGALEVIDRDITLARQKNREVPFIDIRKVGFHPEGVRKSYEVTEFVGNRNPEFSDREMADEELNGVACKRISFNAAYENGSGARLAFWVAPELGYSIVQFRGEVIPAEGRSDAVQTCLTTIEPKEWEDSGLWFPVASTYVCTENGDVVYREEATFEVLSLNEPLDPEYFTIAAVDAPHGTSVYRDPNPRQQNWIWDGQAIVPVDLRSTDPAETEAPGGTNRQMLLLLNAFALCVICVLCFRKYVRQRRQQG